MKNERREGSGKSALPAEKMKKKQVKTWISILCIVILAAVTLIGCGNQGADETESGNEKIIALLLKYRGDEYYKDTEATYVAEARARGYDIKVADANQNLQTQIDQMETFIAQKVDLILLSAMDIEGIVPSVKLANEAGIPVVCYDAIPTGGKLLSVIGWDNYEAGNIIGKWAADYISENLEGNANVAILTTPESAQIMSRVEGFKDALKDMEGVKIVAEQGAGTDRAAAMTAAENIVQAGNQIDLFYGNFDNQTFAACSALEAADMKGIGVSAGLWSIEAFQQIEAGGEYFHAGTLVSPYIQAEATFEVIDAHFAGEEVPGRVDIELHAADPENIGEYVNTAEVEALRAEIAAGE